MTKYKISYMDYDEKQYALDSNGEEWEDCYDAAVEYVENVLQPKYPMTVFTIEESR